MATKTYIFLEGGELLTIPEWPHEDDYPAGTILYNAMWTRPWTKVSIINTDRDYHMYVDLEPEEISQEIKAQLLLLT